MKLRAQIMLLVPKGASEISEESGCICELMRPGDEVPLNAEDYDRWGKAVVIRYHVDMPNVVMPEEVIDLQKTPEQEEKVPPNQAVDHSHPAFKLGLAASKVGKEETDNPYAHGTWSAKQWEHGRKEGAEQADAGNG